MAAKSLEDYSVDELVAHARGLEAKAGFFDAINKNPETRESTLRMLKKVKPDLNIPEIDAKDAVMAAVGKQGETIEALERKLMEREARDNVRERRLAIRDKYRLSDEDVTRVEQLMVDEKEANLTHDMAARLYRAQQQSAPATPASFSPPSYQMPEKDIWGGAIGNPAKLNKIAMEQAYEAWGEIVGGKVAGLVGARLQ
jgi:hypothetical protein